MKKNKDGSKIIQVERLHIFLGVLGVVLGIPPFFYYLNVFTATNESHSTFPAGIAYLTQSIVLLIFLMVCSMRLYWNCKHFQAKHEALEQRFTRTLAQFAKFFHTLPHIKRDLLTNKTDPARSIEVKAVTNGLIDYCDDIKHGFECLFHDTGKPFSVTIKAIGEITNNDMKVVVLARDKIATRADSHRVDNRLSHSVKENTAFLQLLGVRPPVFACDDLVTKSSAGAGGYLNTSPNWRERYNATMVVPIRKNHVGPDGLFEIVGYIGVDTMLQNPGVDQVFCHGQEKPREDIMDFLLGYADSLYGILTRGRIVGEAGLLAPMGYSVVNPENIPVIQDLHKEFLNRCVL